MKRFFPLSLFVICLLFLPFELYGSSLTKEVLLLNSYDKGNKWSNDIMAGIRSVFFDSKLDVSLRVEYMDTKKIASKEYIERLRDVYRFKYANSRLDLILTSDDSAYNFMTEYGQKLFPDVPIVFCGVNNFEPSQLEGKQGITGVAEWYDINKTVDVMLSFHPGLKKIYYVNDSTVTGKLIQKKMDKTIKLYSHRVQFAQLSGTNLRVIESQAGNLQADSAILMLIYFRDREGTSYSYAEAVERLAKSSTIPLYGVWNFHLGHGIIGGMLTSGYYQGRTAAEMALHILKGETPESIPVKTEQTTRFGFDYLKLEQFNILPDKLPPESEIINYSGNSKKRILVLNSYHKGMPWEDDIDKGFQKALGEDVDDLEIFYDFMDIKRNSDPAFVDEIYHYFLSKYVNRKFDAILAVDDAAFHFLTKHHDKIFSETPVVFCGVNYFNASRIPTDTAPWFTGILESYDLNATLETALSMQPQAKKVIIINDTTFTGKANKQNINRLLAEFRDDIEFELWEDLSMPDICSRVKGLGWDTIVLLLSYCRDGSNNIFSYTDSARLISSASRVPVYSIGDFLLGSGVLGGMMTSGEHQGETAGGMIKKILAGESVFEMPLIRVSPNKYMFDSRVMSRFGITSIDLPSESIVINQPYSWREFYADNRGVALVFIALVISVILLMLLVILMWNRLVERKRFEKELKESRNVAERANAAKGRFLANMSHEIRTPMNGLIGMTNLALETNLNETQRGYLDVVKSSAQSLLRVINDILDYSKIEAGKLELAEEQFDLYHLLSDVVTLFATGAEQKELKLNLDIGESVPQTVVGDSVRLRQVLCNLVGNGIKFTDNGEVILEVRSPNVDSDESEVANVHFLVKDTGPGIDLQLQDKLFKEFSQLDFRTRQGTGLGLFISQKLVAIMKGELLISSEVGKGSSFSFEIPLLCSSSKLEKRNEDISIKNVMLQAGILIAEDDEVSQSLLKILLEQRGCTVKAVANGRAAVEAIKQEPSDLIFMDINMPEMNGLEATSRIRSMESELRHVPIIGLSANAMKGDEQKGLEAGMNDYLTKPINLGVLQEKIIEWLPEKVITKDNLEN